MNRAARALLAVALIGSALVALALAPGYERWLPGWPLGLGRESPAEQDQAVLAFQRRGPNSALAEADPGGPAPGRGWAQAGPPAAGAGPVATGGGRVVTVTAPLTGDLAPQSAAAVLMEYHSGRVLYARNEHQRRPMASVTKVMTLSLVFDALESGRVQLSDRVTASARAQGMGGSQIWLEEGESMSLHEMLIAIAVGSANDAAVAVAEHLYGSVERFVDAMNHRAAELGMTNTRFANPHGLDDPGQYSTAYDLARLARHASSHQGLLGYTAMWIEHLRDGKTLQSNHNRLVRHFPGCDGLKTGWTETAGYCLAATAQREGSRFISVVLGAPTGEVRFRESANLLNAAFASFRAVPLAGRGELMGETGVERGTVPRVGLLAQDDFGAVVARGTDPDLQKRVVMTPGRLFAPVEAGQVLGELVVEAEGVEVGRVRLVASRAVPRANLWQLMGKAFTVLLCP